MDTDTLIASLTATHTTDDDALYLDDGAYLDWTSRDTDGGRSFELGDGTDAVCINLTPDQLRQLHTALTLTLLYDAQ
jgi:hypothetical protein